MSNTSQAAYSKYTGTQYKALQAMLRAAGYKYKRSLQSAQEFLTWTKDGCRPIEISGWHGVGKGSRNYGSGRVCFALYIGNFTGETVKFEPISCTELNPERSCKYMGEGVFAEYKVQMGKLIALIETELA